MGDFVVDLIPGNCSKGMKSWVYLSLPTLSEGNPLKGLKRELGSAGAGVVVLISSGSEHQHQTRVLGPGWEGGKNEAMN